MGKHDQDNVKDGQWSKPVPQDDVRDTRKDDGKHSGGGAEQDSGHDSDQDEK